MTHWRELDNPDYLGVYSIKDGKDIVLTIDYVRQEEVIGNDGKKKQCKVAHFVEKSKPMVINSTNAKRIQRLYKTAYIEEWKGKKIQLGLEKGKSFGEITDLLRIREFVPKVGAAKKVLCECCGEEIKAMGGRSAEQLAAYTKEKYGSALCAKCATEAANGGKTNETDSAAQTADTQ